MGVTIREVIVAAEARRVSLAGEMAGYLVLGLADQVANRPRSVAPHDVELEEVGTLSIRAPLTVTSEEAGRQLRGLLAELLQVCRTVSPALLRASMRRSPEGVTVLIQELEAALIPVNRAAGRRALARVFRETNRALETMGELQGAALGAEGSGGALPSPTPVVSLSGSREAGHGDGEFTTPALGSPARSHREHTAVRPDWRPAKPHEPPSDHTQPLRISLPPAHDQTARIEVFSPVLARRGDLEQEVAGATVTVPLRLLECAQSSPEAERIPAPAPESGQRPDLVTDAPTPAAVLAAEERHPEPREPLGEPCPLRAPPVFLPRRSNLEELLSRFAMEETGDRGILCEELVTLAEIQCTPPPPRAAARTGPQPGAGKVGLRSLR